VGKQLNFFQFNSDGQYRNFPFLLLYSSIVSLYVSFEETSLSSLDPHFSNDFNEV
jgi:hypothetical protein